MEIDRPQFTDPIPSLISSDIIITTFFKYGLVSASLNHQIEKQEIWNEKEYIFDLSDHQHVEGCHVYPKHPGICKKYQSG